MKTVLETKALTKRYRGFEALRGLDLCVPQGAIYGLVGRNGAGKTTLIRLICGLQTPTGGTFSLYGIENNDPEIRRARRRMGAVIETPAVYPDMTAEENIRQQNRVLGVPDDDGVAPLLKLVGLGDTGSKRVRNFSLGMRQRLGIAVALAGQPDFLVLDEPTNGLDPQGIVEIRELILRLNREHGITVLISSHILDELSRLATHYGFVDSGRTVRQMSAAELATACRKRLRVKVSDTKRLAQVLEEKHLDYSVLSGTDADIYSDIPVSDLVHALDAAGGALLSVRETDESLESFYMELVGGGHHDETACR